MIDGGPAFPRPGYQGMTVAHDPQAGMSLRDHFAGEALSIFEFDVDTLRLLQAGHEPNHEPMAKFCYGLADAMLKEREKK